MVSSSLLAYQSIGCNSSELIRHPQTWEEQGLGAMDALHLACASLAKVDYFCTCDDRLLSKAKAMSGLSCQVIGLLNLVVEVSR